MADASWLIGASLASLAGVGVLRASWSRPQRSRAMNVAGWSLLLGAALYGSALGGAWGIAVVALSPMSGALALLAIAAFRSPPAKLRSADRRNDRGASERAPTLLRARSLTFVIVAIVAAILGMGIATASGALALLGGAAKSDAYATTLFMMPLAWGVLAFALLMQPHRRAQLKVLAFASLPTWPCLAAGIVW